MMMTKKKMKRRKLLHPRKIAVRLIFFIRRSFKDARNVRLILATVSRRLHP